MQRWNTTPLPAPFFRRLSWDLLAETTSAKELLEAYRSANVCRLIVNREQLR